MEQIKTICAISTPPGKGGIAVVRLSGPRAFEIADSLWRGKSLQQAQSHTIHLGKVVDSEDNILDEALASVFRAPNSFTGEDVVEFSLHGSIYVQRAMVEALIRRGASLAEPGEFTRRAFTNGRMDLAEAEAVADMIAASSRAAHALAVSQLQGLFSTHIDALRDRLITLASLIELELDFSEEDVAFADRRQLRSLAEEAAGFIARLCATFAQGNDLRNGVPVAIVGRPNAGKSSLLNTLLGSNRAIVSDIPGTTRDTVEESTDIAGITFRFIDTAGLRSTDDPIEMLGIERAYASVERARIIVWLIDPDLNEEEAEATLHNISARLPQGAVLIPVMSKCDLSHASVYHNLNDTPLGISSKTGEGIEELKQRMTEIASAGLPDDESLIITNARHYEALRAAGVALDDVIRGLSTLTPDLLAEHLREAIEALGSITGSITSDTILHTIFSRFCIGK